MSYHTFVQGELHHIKWAKKVCFLLFLYIFNLMSGLSQSKNQYTYLQPFDLHVDPMKRLLLINFEKDPDDIYIGFEPQTFDDPINGSGHLVIGWRRDGKIDVYHDDKLRINPAKFDIAGAGADQIVKTTFEKQKFEILNEGVQADFEFVDILGREVIIHIKESNSKKRNPFALLAPMGDAAKAPSAMPLVFLYDFYFVRRKNTEVVVKINDREHRLDKLPMRMDRSKMYFTRYSNAPLIATFCPAFEGNLLTYTNTVAEGHVDNNDHILSLVQTEDKIAFSKIAWNQGIHPVTIHFKPAFPNLADLLHGDSLDGKFTIIGGPGSGSVEGTYKIKVENEAIDLSLTASGGWKPKPDRFSIWFIYTVGKPFKNWPKSYTWEAKIKKQQNNTWHMTSQWNRIKP